MWTLIKKVLGWFAEKWFQANMAALNLVLALLPDWIADNLTWLQDGINILDFFVPVSWLIMYLEFAFLWKFKYFFVIITVKIFKALTPF